MKLEVGMYVRYIPTQGEYTQKISKITKMENRILDIGYQLDNEKDLVFSCHFDQIINANHNIIDLIEVGDYVNGFPVIHKENDILKCGLLVQFKENEIKSIVTKEQFESIKYSLEG